jgi:hypothetical protein
MAGPARLPRLRPALAVIGCVLAAVIAACGGGEEQGAPGPVSACADVAFTPNSGNGLFRILARNVSCAEARRELRGTGGDPSKLGGWDCTRTRRYEVSGASRYLCTSPAPGGGDAPEREIAFDTGN